MLKEKDYCDKDLSLALKEVGYIGQGRCYYDLDKEPNKLRHLDIQVLTTRSAEALNFVLAVHLYDAQKWLREKHNLHIEIIYSPSCWTCKIYDLKEWDYIKGFTFIESYEEALSEGLRYAVKILKENETIHE